MRRFLLRTWLPAALCAIALSAVSAQTSGPTPGPNAGAGAGPNAGPGAGQTGSDWPQRPVTIVVPFAAGGGVDILTRAIADRLSVRLGQRVVVDNRVGAGGNIGVDAVAKAAPDGYTLVMATTGTHTINPGLYRKLPYDAARDFAPITLIASVPNLLVVHPAVPATTVAELVALAKARPGEVSYASFGNGTSNHLSGEMFKRAAGFEAVHVPYRNAPQAVTDLIGERVTFAFVNTPLALPHVRSGRLRALAVSGASRSPSTPEFPTMAEAGVAGFAVESWYGLMAPAGTPDAVVRRLHEATVGIVESDEVRTFFAQRGADVVTSTPAAFAAMANDERSRWAKVIEAANASID